MVKHETKDYFLIIGQQIAEHRKDAGLTQAELAQELHIRQQALALYESGQRRIPLPTLVKLSTVLNVPLIEFLPEQSTTRRRGPIPKIQRQLDLVRTMPAEKQKLILGLIEQLSKQE